MTDSFVQIHRILTGWAARHGLEVALEQIGPGTDLPDASAAEPWTDDERAILATHRHPARRSAWIAGRRAAKRAAVSWSRGRGGPETVPAVLRHPSGKPRLAGRDDLFVSISHAGPFAAAVVSDRPVGMDLETLDERPECLGRFFFSDSEAEWTRRIPSCSSLRRNLLWTRKEAVSKLLGQGGQLDFAKLPVLDGETPWLLSSDTTSTHALSLAMDRN